MDLGATPTAAGGRGQNADSSHNSGGINRWVRLLYIHDAFYSAWFSSFAFALLNEPFKTMACTGFIWHYSSL